MEHDCVCESPVYDKNNRCKACGGVEPFERPAPPDSLEKWSKDAAFVLAAIEDSDSSVLIAKLLARARALGVGK